jgi:hypothetical protein
MHRSNFFGFACPRCRFISPDQAAEHTHTCSGNTNLRARSLRGLGAKTSSESTSVSSRETVKPMSVQADLAASDSATRQSGRVQKRKLSTSADGSAAKRGRPAPASDKAMEISDNAGPDSSSGALLQCTICGCTGRFLVNCNRTRIFFNQFLLL